MKGIKYPISKQGVFLTLQGEGSLLGTPMVFIRLAGCNVNCPLCDTDYKANKRVSIEDISCMIGNVWNKSVSWVFVTGGEPTMHNLEPLLFHLKNSGMSVGLATAGEKLIYRWWDKLDYLYVSPHNPSKWVQRHGSDLNIVPFLNNFSIRDFVGTEDFYFSNKFVTPCEGRADSLESCVKWTTENMGWRMGVQAHKSWGIW
jgi:organic radical activating enzyme